MLQRMTRRYIILLLGLICLALFALIVVGILILQDVTTPPPKTPTAPEPVSTVTFRQVTAVNQYKIAVGAAETWAPDVQLLKASTQWSKVIGLPNVGEPSEWSFHFLSPSNKRKLFVFVAPDGSVRTIQHIRREYAPLATIDSSSWVLDSPDALALWLDHGGEALVRDNPGLEMVIQLRAVPTYPNPVWLVVGSSNLKNATLTVYIDAVERKVIR